MKKIIQIEVKFKIMRLKKLATAFVMRSCDKVQLQHTLLLPGSFM